MKIYVALALHLPIQALADDHQPFADVGQIRTEHVAKIVPDDLQRLGIKQRKLDPGEGVSIICDSPEVENCSLNRDPVKAIRDLPCAAHAQATVIRLAQCPGGVSPVRAAHSSEILDRIAAYIAQNAVPVRDQAKIRAAALSAFDDELGASDAEFVDLCGELQDKDSLSRKMIVGPLETAIAPDFWARLETALATPRPVLTFCADKFVSLGD